jgi:hypothetical protein
MDCFIASLDDHHKQLQIQSIGTSSSGDIYISTNLNPGVHLTSPRDTNNARLPLPVYDAALEIIHMFRKNRGHIVQGYAEVGKDIDFSFDQQDVIAFATPKDIPELAHKRLDFIRSKNGFFGMHTRMGMDMELPTLTQDDVVWLCGPKDKNLADRFGGLAYNLRRQYFGDLYDMVASDPPRIQNPIYPMANGQNFIIKGNRHAHH